jgi:nucleotide-binding universal stress UspA family protein
MYTKVLVPLDGSALAEQILPYARLMAEACGARIELLWVTDTDGRPPFWPPQQGDEYLHQLALRYFPSSKEVVYAEKVGDPAAVIIDTAKDDARRLIAMATHGTSGVRRWLLGSVASKVIQNAHNPLLLIRPEEGEPQKGPLGLKTIFVPLDGSALAETVLPHVSTLAKKLKAEAHLLRVYTVPVNTYVVGDGVIGQPSQQDREEWRRLADSYLEGKTEALRAAGLESVVATSIPGDPALEIIEIARKTPNNLIAMCTHGRSGIGRWLLGSVAEKVVQHSGDPVLLIRPA